MLKQFVRHKAERFCVWALQQCLTKQAWVLTREFKRLTDRADTFEAEVQFVAADHYKHLNALHERMLKLEQVSE